MNAPPAPYVPSSWMVSTPGEKDVGVDVDVVKIAYWLVVTENANASMAMLMTWLRRLFAPTFQLEADDITVFVVGPSGSGKSSFVQHATRSAFVKIGTGLQPRTANVQAIRCDLTEEAKEALGVSMQKHIVFVDTPSFHTGQNDDAAEREMKSWLSKSGCKSTIVGTIYMHRVETDPQYEPIQQHLDTFAYTLPPGFVSLPERVLGILSYEGVISQDTIERRRAIFHTQLHEVHPSLGPGVKLNWVTSVLPDLFKSGDTETAWKAVVALFSLARA